MYIAVSFSSGLSDGCGPFTPLSPCEPGSGRSFSAGFSFFAQFLFLAVNTGTDCFYSWWCETLTCVAAWMSGNLCFCNAWMPFYLPEFWRASSLFWCTYRFVNNSLFLLLMIEPGVVSCLENLLLCATKTSILVRNNEKKDEKKNVALLYFIFHMSLCDFNASLVLIFFVFVLSMLTSTA